MLAEYDQVLTCQMIRVDMMRLMIEAPNKKTEGTRALKDFCETKRPRSPTMETPTRHSTSETEFLINRASPESGPDAYVIFEQARLSSGDC